MSKKTMPRLTKKDAVAVAAQNAADGPQDAGQQRKHLLAGVAGSIASGIVSSPSESTGTAAAIAAVAVDVAEEILKKIGL